MLLVSNCPPDSTTFPFYSVPALGHGEQPFGVHLSVHPGHVRTRCRRIQFCVLRNPPMHTMLFSQSRDIPYALSGSLRDIGGGAFGLAFGTVQARAGALRFKRRVSCSPRLDKVSAKLCTCWILEVPLGLAARSGDRIV